MEDPKVKICFIWVCCGGHFVSVNIKIYSYISREEYYTRLKISCMATPFLYSLFCFYRFYFSFPNTYSHTGFFLKLFSLKESNIFSISFSLITCNFFQTFDFLHDVCQLSGQIRLLMKQNIILFFLLIFNSVVVYISILSF